MSLVEESFKDVMRQYIAFPLMLMKLGLELCANAGKLLLVHI